MRRASVRPRLALAALIAVRVLAPPEAHAQEAEPSEALPPADVPPQEPVPAPPELPAPVQPEPPALPPEPEVPPESAPGPSEPPPAGSEQKPPEQKPPEQKPPEQKPPEKKPKEDTWLDAGHGFIEQRIFAPVLRLDRFFSDERDLEAERSRSFLRWRSEVRFEQRRDAPAFTTGLRANLRFPGLNKRLERLRLVIEGQTRNTIAALFPGEQGAPTAPEGEEPIGTAEAGLRFRFWETLVSHGDLGAGLLFGMPPGAFGRIRMRLAVPVKKLLLTRYVATGFWRTDTHLGTSAALEAERPVARMVVARLGGGATLTQRSKGIEWLSELALLASFDVHSAAQTGVTVNGATRGEPRRLDRWRIYARLRRDFYRRWLFFEIEPDISWPFIEGIGRRELWGIAGRLEVQFQGNERPPPPPAAIAREPQDPP